jgi:DNA repair exonuclease SbcCD ATPase subunit
MKFNTTLLTIGAFAFSLTSCSVYYTTSEVDSSLKSTVDQVNATVKKLHGQVSAMEQQYLEIQCDQKSAAFVTADQMVKGIETQMNLIDNRSTAVNQIYSQFKEYTKGKDKIQSGTPEWDQVKEAKEGLKVTLAEIQAEGNALVEKGNAFNEYVTNSLVPTIQLCDVAQYTTQFEKAISDLSKNQKEVGNQLTQYQKQVAELIAKYSTTKPALCKELSADLQKINTDVTQISRIKMNLQMAVNAFKTNTQGKTKIYSCSSDWKVVTDAENAVNTQQKEANALQQSIQTTATHLQTVVIALGQ